MYFIYLEVLVLVPSFSSFREQNTNHVKMSNKHEDWRVREQRECLESHKKAGCSNPSRCLEVEKEIASCEKAKV